MQASTAPPPVATIAFAQIREKLRGTVEKLRGANSNFDAAYDTYVQQYGEEKVSYDAEPLNLSHSIDPVALVFGRNCVAYYSDATKTLSGSLGSLQLKKSGDLCIIGRRQPQDQKLLCWSGEGEEIELSIYNSWASIIPSRVHGALLFANPEEVYFVDLGSSSGTVIVGESPTLGPFVRVYDPGSPSSISIERKSTIK